MQIRVSGRRDDPRFFYRQKMRRDDAAGENRHADPAPQRFTAEGIEQPRRQAEIDPLHRRLAPRAAAPAIIATIDSAALSAGAPLLHQNRSSLRMRSTSADTAETSARIVFVDDCAPASLPMTSSIVAIRSTSPAAFASFAGSARPSP